MIRLFALALCLVPSAALSQARGSHCIAIVQNWDGPAQLIRAQASATPLGREEVTIDYVGHSTFLITTPEGHTIATDYAGFAGPGVIPDVVTMNQAHSSHWTPFPDTRIPHVLRGWESVDGSYPADHGLVLGEALIRNVTTDIRGGAGGRIPDGNSIFVIETGGLCIGHLGHLHHPLTDQHYALIGRLDVVMVPVDGGLTLDLPSMIEVTERLRASIVIPMHWFGTFTLRQFTLGMEEYYRIVPEQSGRITLSLWDLPTEPELRVLAPGGGGGLGNGFNRGGP